MGVGKQYKWDIETFFDNAQVPEREAAIRKKLTVKFLNIPERSVY